MHRIYFDQAPGKYELTELVRMFLPPSSFQIEEADPREGTDQDPGDVLLCIPAGIRDKNEAKRFLYQELSRWTGKKPDWGTLTGVRPVKLTGDLLHREGLEEKAAERLATDYLVSPEKIRLLLETRKVQEPLLTNHDPKAVGLYIGIPFCPTRCVYCSFTSNQASPEKIEAYLEALEKEVRQVGRRMKDCGLYPESIYIGGGTPTTLSAEELDRLFLWMEESMDLSRRKEFTVEAGRPDTITEEKLQVIRAHGADRISINPQSMKSKTLELIGRNHSPEQTAEAFEIAARVGIPVINTDLIAGLPEEEPEDFFSSLQQILDFGPANITVHTLAVKRASQLREADEEYSYHRQPVRVRTMLEAGREMLDRAGYRPYYLYRQKQMTGNFENVGYCRPGTENLYNIRIMEEDQTILALGAGGISKMYYPGENRLERVPNVSNYEIYIQRLDEMLERKENGIFREYGNLQQR